MRLSGGPMGVPSKLYGPLMHSHAKMLGSLQACQRRLIVISACGRRRSHRDLGNVGSTLARTVRKCTLKVRMARSTAFRRCITGGTSWNLHFHLSVMVALYVTLASLLLPDQSWWLHGAKSLADLSHVTKDRSGGVVGAVLGDILQGQPWP